MSGNLELQASSTGLVDLRDSGVCSPTVLGQEFVRLCNSILEELQVAIVVRHSLFVTIGPVTRCNVHVYAFRRIVSIVSIVSIVILLSCLPLRIRTC